MSCVDTDNLVNVVKFWSKLVFASNTKKKKNDRIVLPVFYLHLYKFQVISYIMKANLWTFGNYKL